MRYISWLITSRYFIMLLSMGDILQRSSGRQYKANLGITLGVDWPLKGYVCGISIKSNLNWVLAVS